MSNTSEPSTSPGPDPNGPAGSSPRQAPRTSPGSGQPQTGSQPSQPQTGSQPDQPGDGSGQTGPAPGGQPFSHGSPGGSPNSTPGGFSHSSPNSTPGNTPRPPDGGFFGSVRRTGVVRTQQRWAGGVAGGVARRLGIDPTLVRCLWVAVMLLTGIGLFAYGVGWALLPEEHDGRIHVEEALSGRFEAGLAGAVGAAFVGMNFLPSGLLPGWYSQLWDVPDLAWLLWSLFWTALLAVAVIGGIRYLSSSNTDSRSQPSAGAGAPYPAGAPSPAGAPAGNAPLPEDAAPTGNAPSGAQTAQTGTTPSPQSTAPSSPARPAPQAAPAGPVPPAAGPTPGSWTAPGPAATGPTPGSWTAPGPAAPGRPYPGPGYPGGPYPLPTPASYGPATPRLQVRRPGPGRAVSLTVLGLALLSTASILAAAQTERIGVVQANLFVAGAIVALLGGGIVVSGLRRRRGGWMTALGWPALLLVLPGLVLSMLTPPSVAGLPWREVVEASENRTVVTWEELAASAGGSSSVTHEQSLGYLVLDLRDMPADAASTISTISARIDVGNLQIRTSGNPAVRIHGQADMGGINARLTGSWQVGRSTLPTTSSAGGTGLYTVDGRQVSESEYHVSGTSQEATLTSAAAAEATSKEGVVTVNASADMGSVDIIAEPDEVTWYGNPQEDVWIVSRWYAAGGSNPQTSMPVPGMDHAAITSDAATTCLTSTREEHNNQIYHGSQDPGTSEEWVYAGWSDISDLEGEQRSAYDTCVDQLLTTGAGDQRGTVPVDPVLPGSGPSAATTPSTGASDGASPAPSATATP